MSPDSSSSENLNVNLSGECAESRVSGERFPDQILQLFGLKLHPRVYLLGRSWCSFHVWGAAALASAFVLTMSLAIVRGMSTGLMAIITLVAVSTIFGLAMFIKVVTGEEQNVHYHHATLILLLTALVTWLSGEQVLRYLDLTILGIGQFLWVGRIGCLMVGCCHGRPYRWGVCYGKEHADAGFAYPLVGVRLFPSQVLEALLVVMIVAGGIFLFLTGRPAGAVLSWYVMAYGGGRTMMEFLRGDPERPYLWGYSEAQWTSLLFMSLIVWLEARGVLPFQTWHVVAILILLLTMIGIAGWRRSQPRMARRLVSPRHAVELAEVLEFVTEKASEIGSQLPEPGLRSARSPHRVQLAFTSIGLQLSAGRINTSNQLTYYYALSQSDGLMTAQIAESLAALIVKLRRAKAPGKLIPGANGVFHLLLPGQEVPHT